MKKTRIIGSIMLFITAFIWGAAFVAQSVAMDSVGALTFGGLRFILGGIVLLPMIAVSGWYKKKNCIPTVKNKKDLILGGTVCGVILFLGSYLQQYGIRFTSVGKASFITSLYIVLVPLFAFFVFKRKITPLVAVSVIFALVGMYLLSISGVEKINKGDLYIFFSTLMYSFHILAIDYFAPKVDGVQLSCFQFLVCGVIGMILAFIFEGGVTISQIRAIIIPLLFAGVLSCGVAYTLQVLGQVRTPPTISSLIMSLESVFGALSGAVILGQLLSAKEIAGCIFMFTGVILAQLPMPSKVKTDK